jgi:predicted GNAT superfamily acetyltransferase
MTSAPQAEIRPCRTLEDFEACVDLEKTVWGSPDIEVVPSALFAVTPKTGGQVFGAFASGRMIGFVLAFPGCHGGAPGQKPVAYLHSHMTAVLPEFQNSGLGRRLKLFQREEALSRGIGLVEWTFDPLEIRNAHFNLLRLGAIVRRFIPNLYGITSSPLHAGMPTDRLLAEWWLDSLRVRAIVAGHPPAIPSGPAVERIEIPAGIAAIRKNDPAEALRIQSHLRESFQDCFARNYALTGLERHPSVDRYILEPSSALGLPS